MSGIQIGDTKFNVCDFTESNLKLTNGSMYDEFIMCNFKKSTIVFDIESSKINNCNFEEFTVIHSEFRNCELTNNKFITSNIHSTTFNYCKFNDSTFDNVDIKNSIFRVCDVTNTNFSNNTNITNTRFLDTNGLLSINLSNNIGYQYEEDYSEYAGELLPDQRRFIGNIQAIKNKSFNDIEIRINIIDYLLEKESDKKMYTCRFS